MYEALVAITKVTRITETENKSLRENGTSGGGKPVHYVKISKHLAEIK